MRKQQKQPEKTFVLCPKPITPVVCLKMSRTAGARTQSRGFGFRFAMISSLERWWLALNFLARLVEN